MYSIKVRFAELCREYNLNFGKDLKNMYRVLQDRRFLKLFQCCYWITRKLPEFQLLIRTPDVGQSIRNYKICQN
jgi:hypothetical protein